MNVPALKAALAAYSGPYAIDPQEACYRHVYENGVEQLIPFGMAAEGALTRIVALERELTEAWSDPDVKHIRQAKRKEK